MTGNKWSPELELASIWKTIKGVLENPEKVDLQIASEAKPEVRLALKVAPRGSDKIDSTFTVVHSIMGSRHSFIWTHEGHIDAFLKIMDVIRSIKSKNLDKKLDQYGTCRAIFFWMNEAEKPSCLKERNYTISFKS